MAICISLAIQLKYNLSLGWEDEPQSHYCTMMLVFLIPLIGVEGEKEEGQNCPECQACL